MPSLPLGRSLRGAARRTPSGTSRSPAGPASGNRAVLEQPLAERDGWQVRGGPVVDREPARRHRAGRPTSPPLGRLQVDGPRGRRRRPSSPRPARRRPAARRPTWTRRLPASASADDVAVPAWRAGPVTGRATRQQQGRGDARRSPRPGRTGQERRSAHGQHGPPTRAPGRRFLATGCPGPPRAASDRRSRSGRQTSAGARRRPSASAAARSRRSKQRTTGSASRSTSALARCTASAPRRPCRAARIPAWTAVALVQLDRCHVGPRTLPLRERDDELVVVEAQRPPSSRQRGPDLHVGQPAAGDTAGGGRQADRVVGAGFVDDQLEHAAAVSVDQRHLSDGSRRSSR